MACAPPICAGSPSRPASRPPPAAPHLAWGTPPRFAAHRPLARESPSSAASKPATHAPQECSSRSVSIGVTRCATRTPGSTCDAPFAWLLLFGNAANISRGVLDGAQQFDASTLPRAPRRSLAGTQNCEGRSATPSNLRVHAITAASPRLRTSDTMRAAARSHLQSRVHAPRRTASCSSDSAAESVRRSSCSIRASQHDLVQRIFHDSLRFRGLELRNDLPHHRFFHNRVDRHPVRIGQVGNRGILQRRQRGAALSPNSRDAR